MNNEGEEVSIKELVNKVQNWYNFLIKRWKLLLIVSISGILTGLIFSIINKPLYTADLNFAVQDEKQGGLGSAAGLASQFGFDLGGSTSGAFSGDNLIELLKSRAMVEKSLLTTRNIKGKTETLADFYFKFNNTEKSLKEEGVPNLHYPINQPRTTFTLKQDSVLYQIFKDLLKNSLAVDKTDKKLSIIQVRVISKNELFSKFFAESLVKTVSEYYVETTTQKESQNVTILQHQTDSVRRELNKAISGVASSMDVNSNPNPSLQILRAPSQRRQIDVQANTAILTELEKNLELSKISLRKETPLIQIIDNPILPLDKTHVGKLKAGLLGALLFMIASITFLSITYIYKQLMKG